MSPYYQDEAVTIYHGDCLELLPKVSGATLVFADPPFNIGKKYGRNGDRRGDYREWCENWIAACFNALSDAGTFYLMTLVRHLEWKFPLMARHGEFLNLICWRNVSAAHEKRRFWNAYQPILCYGKTAAHKFNDLAERREATFKVWQKARAARYSWRILDYWEDIRLISGGNVKHPEAILEANSKRKLHPCQMPLGLAMRAISFSTDVGDLVVEPFMGTGTTLRAAKDLNRRAIGFDVEERYCELSARRMAQKVLL